MKLKVSRTVILLSIVSLLNDMASEMILPLLPLFIVSVGANAVIVGMIAGLTESIANLSKFFFGIYSDKIKKRKAFVFTGYFSSAIGKLVYSIAFSWPIILIARMIDRLGKGVRVAPADALISENTIEGLTGRAFGFHRAFDTFGAVLGVILAIIFFWFLKLEFRQIFFIAGLISFLALIPLLFLKESKAYASSKNWFSTRNVNSKFKVFLLASSLFYLGNFSYMFFILKANDLLENVVDSTLVVLLLYLLFNVFYSFFSFPFGILSDKIGRKKVVVLAYAMFAFTCIGFAFFNNLIAFIALFAIYGLFNALLEGNEKAFVADLADPEFKASSQGLFQTITGIIMLPSSLIAGFLWESFGAQYAFYFGFVMSVLALIILVFGLKR